jgi:hypothetical protein
MILISAMIKYIMAESIQEKAADDFPTPSRHSCRWRNTSCGDLPFGLNRNSRRPVRFIPVFCRKSRRNSRAYGSDTGGQPPGGDMVYDVLTVEGRNNLRGAWQ